MNQVGIPMEIVGWAERNEMTLFNRGNCGLKDSSPPTGGVGPVGAQCGGERKRG